MKVRAAVVDDVLAVPGSPDLLVMTDEHLVRLGPLGRRLFESAAEGRTLEELVADAVAAFGPAPGDGGASAIGAAVDGLVDAGLLERVE